MAIMTDIETRLRERLSRPGRVQISAKTWSTAYAAIGAPKVFESAEALSFAAAWSPIISRTTLIPASLFVMIESCCKAQVTPPVQDYPNGSRIQKHRKAPALTDQSLERSRLTETNQCAHTHAWPKAKVSS